MRDPILRDARVRTAIAARHQPPAHHPGALSWRSPPRRKPVPPQHWAWTADTGQHPFNPAVANALLDQAGYRRGPGGVRFHIGMKTSNDETVRLMAVAIQEQLAQVGIALDLRSYEFATFYSDLTRGAFQLAPSRWIGGNENPDIFRYAYSSSTFPPRGANRGFYSSPEMDRLISDATSTTNRQQQIADYVRIQQTRRPRPALPQPLVPRLRHRPQPPPRQHPPQPLRHLRLPPHRDAPALKESGCPISACFGDVGSAQSAPPLLGSRS